MYRESIIMHYTIICTSSGYMVEQEDDNCETFYVDDKNGDNTFTTYAEACGVLADHLMKVKNEQTN